MERKGGARRGGVCVCKRECMREVSVLVTKRAEEGHPGGWESAGPESEIRPPGSNLRSTTWQ